MIRSALLLSINVYYSNVMHALFCHMFVSEDGNQATTPLAIAHSLDGEGWTL
jgi:hypothetical protein